MFQGFTELLWICRLTRLIWTPRFKFVSLTPNINSHTFLTQWTSHMMSGTIFHLLKINQVSSTCCTKNFSMICCSTVAYVSKSRREWSKSRPAVINVFLIAASSAAASSPITIKVRGCRQLRGNPIAGWVLNQAHSTQCRCLNCDSWMHTLEGRCKTSGETRRNKKKNTQKIQTILRLEPATTKRNLFPKTMNLLVKPFAHWSSSSVDHESQNNTEATWDQYLHIWTDTSHSSSFPLSERSMEHNRAISSSRFISEKDWREFKMCEEFQLFSETKKLISGQTSPSLCHCQGLCLRQKWEAILLSLGRSNFSGIQNTIQRVVSNFIDNFSSSSGTFSHYSGSLQWDSTHGKISVSRTSQAGPSSCQCLTTNWEAKQEKRHQHTLTEARNILSCSSRWSSPSISSVFTEQ